MPFDDGANKNVRDENVSDIFGRIAGNISESYNEGGIDGVLLDGISAYAGFIGSSAVSEFNETVIPHTA